MKKAITSTAIPTRALKIMLCKIEALAGVLSDFALRRGSYGSQPDTLTFVRGGANRERLHINSEIESNLKRLSQSAITLPRPFQLR